MGDVVSLVERAQEQFDEEEAKRLEKKIRKNQFDFNDFYNQIQQIKKMGNITRRRRIASGSGTSIQEVNKLIKQFDQTRKMMKMVTGANMKGMMGRMKNMKGSGMPPMN